MTEAKPNQSTRETEPREQTRNAIARYVGSLFTDTKEGQPALSLGRVGFLLLLGLAMWLWGRGQELPEGMLQLLYTLAGYNAVSKGIAKLPVR